MLLDGEYLHNNWNPILLDRLEVADYGKQIEFLHTQADGEVSESHDDILEDFLRIKRDSRYLQHL